MLNALFVRQKVSSSGSWSLVLQNLGVASTSTSTTLDVCSQLALAKALASRVCGNCTEECSEACLFANDFASERRPENRPEHWLTHVVCSEGVDVVHDDWRFGMHPLLFGFAFLMATLLYCQYNECGEFTCRGAQLQKRTPLSVAVVVIEIASGRLPLRVRGLLLMRTLLLTLMLT